MTIDEYLEICKKRCEEAGTKPKEGQSFVEYFKPFQDLFNAQMQKFREMVEKEDRTLTEL